MSDKVEVQERIKIAVQKSGRLSEKSFELLDRCGMDLDLSRGRLLRRCENFPLDLMMLRDDDIPEYVLDGVCELGIVGLDVLEEKLLARKRKGSAATVEVVRRLGFGPCHLALAVPNERPYDGLGSLRRMRIATSYPEVLTRFLAAHGVDADVVEISGSVELAPALGIADAICDLVSSGSTLKSNGLREVACVLASESVLIRTCAPALPEKEANIARLLTRVEGTMRADRTKYVMMNAPKSALPEIRALLPGMEEPTVMPLSGGDRVAVHAVCHETVFWDTMEKLKQAGASSILVVPIEKIL